MELQGDAAFQFHNGSIKSSMRLPHLCTKTRFQFHNGSIKRVVVSPVAPTYSRFNSTMVRLKG